MQMDYDKSPSAQDTEEETQWSAFQQAVTDLEQKRPSSPTPPHVAAYLQSRSTKPSSGGLDLTRDITADLRRTKLSEGDEDQDESKQPTRRHFSIYDAVNDDKPDAVHLSEDGKRMIRQPNFHSDVNRIQPSKPIVVTPAHLAKKRPNMKSTRVKPPKPAANVTHAQQPAPQHKPIFRLNETFTSRKVPNPAGVKLELGKASNTEFYQAEDAHVPPVFSAPALPTEHKPLPRLLDKPGVTASGRNIATGGQRQRDLIKQRNEEAEGIALIEAIFGDDCDDDTSASDAKDEAVAGETKEKAGEETTKETTKETRGKRIPKRVRINDRQAASPALKESDSSPDDTIAQ